MINNVLKKEFITFARSIYGQEFIPLHRPVFEGNEKKFLNECIDSNFVSSVGKKVVEFEKAVAKFVGSKHAVAMSNGTSALHISMLMANVKSGDEVITQALTFVATCNAITYANATPVFVDVDMDTLGMSPEALNIFLKEKAEMKNGFAYNKISGKKISACVPMHTFGLPCRIKEITSICKKWNICLIEDAAESLGSYVDNIHTGNFGEMGVLSFNGNKVITTGGGGLLFTNNDEIAIKAKHLSTTSKVPHTFEFIHDNIGYNYRMPNINAALGCAQMERLDEFLDIKNQISNKWHGFFNEYDIDFILPIDGAKSNFWLNTIILDSKKSRDDFLLYTNKNDVMTRPIWKLMSELQMFKHCQNDGLRNSMWLQDRVVNIPSSIPSNSLSIFTG